MLAFTDSQLRAVWAAADRVPVENGVFLDRVVARLQLHRGFTDADLDDALRAALTALIQSALIRQAPFPTALVDRRRWRRTGASDSIAQGGAHATHLVRATLLVTGKLRRRA